MYVSIDGKPHRVLRSRRGKYYLLGSKQYNAIVSFCARDGKSKKSTQRQLKKAADEFRSWEHLHDYKKRLELERNNENLDKEKVALIHEKRVIQQSLDDCNQQKGDCERDKILLNNALAQCQAQNSRLEEMLHASNENKKLLEGLGYELRMLYENERFEKGTLSEENNLLKREILQLQNKIQDNLIKEGLLEDEIRRLHFTNQELAENLRNLNEEKEHLSEALNQLSSKIDEIFKTQKEGVISFYQEQIRLYQKFLLRTDLSAEEIYIFRQQIQNLENLIQTYPDIGNLDRLKEIIIEISELLISMKQKEFELRNDWRDLKITERQVSHQAERLFKQNEEFRQDVTRLKDENLRINNLSEERRKHILNLGENLKDLEARNAQLLQELYNIRSAQTQICPQEERPSPSLRRSVLPPLPRPVEKRIKDCDKICSTIDDQYLGIKKIRQCLASGTLTVDKLFDLYKNVYANCKSSTQTPFRQLIFMLQRLYNKNEVSFNEQCRKAFNKKEYYKQALKKYLTENAGDSSSDKTAVEEALRLLLIEGFNSGKIENELRKESTQTAAEASSAEESDEESAEESDNSDNSSKGYGYESLIKHQELEYQPNRMAAEESERSRSELFETNKSSSDEFYSQNESENEARSSEDSKTSEIGPVGGRPGLYPSLPQFTPPKPDGSLVKRKSRYPSLPQFTPPKPDGGQYPWTLEIDCNYIGTPQEILENEREKGVAIFRNLLKCLILGRLTVEQLIEKARNSHYQTKTLVNNFIFELRQFMSRKSLRNDDDAIEELKKVKNTSQFLETEREIRAFVNLNLEMI